MSQKLRQEQILGILAERGYVTVRYLTNALHYSSATINRDLNAMQTLGVVKRTYGGVEAIDRNHFFPLPQRQLYMKKEKRRNAHAAAALIENGERIFLDGSTSVQYIAPFLAEKRELTVITNNLRIAVELGEYDIDVICLGGHITERPHIIGGDDAVEQVMRYHADKMFFSVGSVTASGYVSEGSLLHRIMLKNAREAYLLTNQSKLVEHLDETFCDFTALAGVISDFEFPEETKKAFPHTKFICVTG